DVSVFPALYDKLGEGEFPGLRSLLIATASLVFLGACGSQKPETAASAPKSAPPAVAAEPVAPATPVSDPGVPAKKPVSKRLASGTTIPIVLLEAIDSDVPYQMPFITGRVDEDVKGADGGLAIPSGSRALMVPSIQGKLEGKSRL